MTLYTKRNNDNYNSNISKIPILHSSTTDERAQ